MKVVAHDAILILFKHEVKVLKVFQSFDIPESVDEDLIEEKRYSIKTFSLAEIVPLDAVFDKFGNIYLSTTAGELFVLKGKGVRVLGC